MVDGPAGVVQKERVATEARNLRLEDEVARAAVGVPEGVDLGGGQEVVVEVVASRLWRWRSGIL